MNEHPRCLRDEVLCVHGAGGGGWEWQVWRRVWNAQGWRVHTPDLQPAAAGLARTGLADYFAQIREQAAGLRHPVLIGASLGGLIAAGIAADVAARALILINPLMPQGAEPQPAPSRETRAVVPWGSERSLRGSLQAMPDADAAAVLYAYRRWRDESGAVLAQARAGAVLTRPACPILLIASGEDDEVPYAGSVALATQWNASLVSLPQASHVGPLLGRAAAKSAQGALDWLAQLG